MRTFLDEGDGWWWVLGALALLSLLLVRSMMRKLIGAGQPSKHKKKKKKGKRVQVNLREDLALVGEEIQKVEHCLLALDDVPLSCIKRIYSHTKAIEQCTDVLRTLKHCHVESMTDTASAARKVLLPAGIVCCEVDGVEPAAAVSRLRVAGVIASQTPYARSYLRFGTSLLVNEPDVDRTVAAVRGLR